MVAMKLFSRIAFLAVVPALILALSAPSSAVPVGKSLFYGYVTHVSVNNIKVYDPRNGQELSFLILPKFDRVFSGDGKTTYQMKDVKRNRYVKIYFDQRMLGARHADTIYVLNQWNQIKRRE